jgi:hypothetical protein
VPDASADSDSNAGTNTGTDGKSNTFPDCDTNTGSDTYTDNASTNSEPDAEDIRWISNVRLGATSGNSSSCFRV